MAMVCGAWRSQIARQMAFSWARTMAPAEHLFVRSCPVSTLCRSRLLPVSSNALLRASRRGFADASAGGAKDGDSSKRKADEKLEKHADEKADEKAGDKTDEKAETKGASEDQAKTAEAEPKADAEPKEEAAPEDPDVKLRREVAELQGEMKERRHKVLLALADYENDKKKLTKERDARHRRAIVGFATRMVDVYGKFGTKLPVNAEATGDAQASLQEGIGLVRQAFASTLGRFDVKPLSISSGEQFVVTQHETIGTVIGSEYADGVVAEMVTPGWILRPSKGAPAVLARAQVKVARNGPGAPSSL